MKTKSSNSTKRWLAGALIAAISFVCLLCGLFVGGSLTASGADNGFTAIKAELTVETVYDDYTVETIKGALKVTGITAEEQEVAIPSGYTVAFKNGKLTAGNDNVITVTYSGLSTEITSVTVEKAEATAQICAIEEYKPSGGYYINDDGYYAFVQGMTAEQVQSRLAVALVYPNHTEYVPFDGSKVNWTASAPSFGDQSNAGDLTVSVSLSLTGVNGIDDTTVEGDIVFAASRRAGLKLRDGWTQPEEGLTPVTTVQSFIGTLQGFVVAVLNSGLEDSTPVTVTNDLSYSGLYVGATAEAIANCKTGDTFEKVLEIPYNGTDVAPLKLELTVTFEDFAGFGDIMGSLPSQTARSATLNYGDVYVVAKFKGPRGNISTTLYLKDIPDGKIIKMYYDASNNVVTSLTRSVTTIGLGYTPTGDESDVVATGEFQGVQVSPIAIETPVIQDMELTFSDAGCSTTIEGLLTDDAYDDNMQVSVSPAYGTESGGVLTFTRGGQYTVTVSFVNGKNSDFTFRSGVDGVVNAEDPTIVTYTVSVLKAPVEVSLSGFPQEIPYGDGVPSYTVSGAVKGNATMNFTATNKIDSDTLAAEDKTSEAPSYRLYYTGTAADGTAYASYTFPTKRGAYKAHVNTAETGWYAAGELETPFEFEIVERRISLSSASITPVTFVLGTEYSEADVVNQIVTTGFAIADQSNPASVVKVEFSGTNKGKKVTHANDYGVTVTIINDNYKWESTENLAQSTTFTINKASLSFTVSQSGFTFGDIKPDAAIDVSGLRSWATLGTPAYTKDGSAFTAPANGIWLAGSYQATYEIGSYTTGVLASDVDCAQQVASFTVARKELTKVSIDTTNDGQTYKNAEWAFAINNYVKGEQTLANGAKYDYKNILTVTYAGKLVDGTTPITTIRFDADNGIIYVTGAGTYGFEISLNNPNFTWVSEGNNPQAVGANGIVINQKELAFVLDKYSFDYNGEKQVPVISVDWKLSESFTAADTKLQYEYYLDGTKINESDVVDAGDYTVEVTGFDIEQKPSGATYNYTVNYKLPANSSLNFSITTPYLNKPTLKGGNADTYRGKNNPFDFLDYIQGDTYTYTANSDTKCKITFAYSISGTTVNSLAVAGTYKVTVTPADNFKWDDGGVAPVEFTFVIKQLSVSLTWANLSSTYGTAPAATVAISNKVAGDTVSVVIGYKQGTNAVTATSNLNAGNYTVYADSLNGADSANYVIDTESVNVSADYTVLKKELSLPNQPLSAITGTFSASGYNGTVANFNTYNLTSALVGATLSGVRPAMWFNGQGDDAIDTTAHTYSFNVSNGAFTCYDAGYYSVEFTILDSQNYCWAGSGKTADFVFSGTYSHSWSEFAKIERQTLTAPALGANRAMEWDSVIQLNTILTGTLNGVNYGVLYGTNKATDNKTSSNQSDIDGGETRGQYYALLTVSSDALNYVWNVAYDNDDNTGYAGSAFVNGGTVFELIYTVEDGAQVKLYYAITASQVNVQLTVKNYTYGENGAYIGNNENSARIGIGNVIQIKVPATYTDATFNGSAGGGGGVVYTFRVKGGAEISQPELVNGLPWAAGEYEVKIVITFDRNDEGEEVYTEWDSSYQPITVNRRNLVVEWSYNGKTGNNLSTPYNGEGQLPTATITNLPKKDSGDTTSPALTYNLSDNKPVSVALHTVTVTAVEGNNFNVANAAKCSFTITKYTVTIKAEEVSDHVYGEAINVEGKWQYEGDNRFFNSDADNIGLVILLNGAGSPHTSTKTPVNTYKLCPVWNSYTSLSLDENGEYTLETTNYTIHVTAADFVVVKRRLTVNFVANGTASSVYGTTVNLYQDGAIYTVVRDNGTGNALVDNVTDVFTLTATLDAAAATGDSKFWAVGVYSVSGAEKSANYAITFNGAGKYTVTEATITDIDVSGYSGVYDANSHDLFTNLSATTVNDLAVVWQYKDASSATDVWQDYVTDGKPAQIKNVADSKSYYVRATAANHTAAVFKVGSADQAVAVSVSKATLTVQIELAIWYGEKSPAELDGGAFKATVAELTSNSAMYAIAGLKGEAIADIGASGTFHYTTAYTQGNAAGTYTIQFVNDTLTAPNYVFVNATNANGSDKGVLTVNRLALSVAVEDIVSVYYDTYDSFAFVSSVALPNSTYTGVALTESELPATVWNEIFAKNPYEGANIVTITTGAFADTNPTTHTKDVDVYSITGSLKSGITNYTVSVTGNPTHTVQQATDVLTFEMNGWTYGWYSAANPSGFNWDMITEPQAKFSETFKIGLKRGENAIAGLNENYATVTDLFEVMWENGWFNAGEYTLTITTDGTANYGALNETFKFTVEKKELTVRANNQQVTYGEAAPQYTYQVTGFVRGKSGGALDTEEAILGKNLDFFASEYAAGRLNGSVGTYTIEHTSENENKVLDNYSLKFVEGTLTVKQRAITISITDAENFYNLSILSSDGYGKEKVSDWEKGYTVVGVYDGDVEDGTQQIFALRTDALTSTGNKDTNNAGKYPIYAEWLEFDKDGVKVSFGENYTVTFKDCSYSDELPSNAIKQGTNCAGTYTIKQAILSVVIDGPYNDAEGTQAATNGIVFSNTEKYYKASVRDNTDDGVTFVLTYYQGTVIDAGTKLQNAPVNVGKYTVTATTDNPNYAASTASIPFEITPARLKVEWVINGTVAADIQYGENIPAFNSTSKTYPANSRFSGLSYTFSSSHFEGISEESLIAMLGTIGYSYDTKYTNKTTSDIFIKPVVTVSDNFQPEYSDGILHVIPRRITVQVNGYDEGNTTATSSYTGKSPFVDNKGWTIDKWLKEIETDAFVHGHSLADLGIYLTLDSQVYNASTTPYKVNVVKGSNDVSQNYAVTFVVGAEQLPYGSSVKPTYLITKKNITITANDVTVTYGNALNTYLTNGISQSNLSRNLFNTYFSVSGFENGESYTDLSDSAMQNNQFLFTTAYMPYQSHVGDTIALSISGSTVNFTNYQVSRFVPGKVVVTPRVITASTTDQEYQEATDSNGNKVYNNGVYGASHNAVIEFSGHKSEFGYEAQYAPAFSVSYNTVNGAGQTAKAAPTKVGSYTVTVQLTSNDYVFGNNAKTSDLGFKVIKQTLSPTWLHSAIANVDASADLTNSVAGYVASIMTLSNFQKTIGDDVYNILEGTEPDQYQIGTVGTEQVGLSIKAQAMGEYRVTFTLTAAAKANYRWNDGDSLDEVTIIFNVTTQKVAITSLSIVGWTYKQYDAELNRVRFTVSNKNVSGVQISYARITGAIPKDKADFQKLSYSASIPEAAGNYAVRAYYPTYEGVGGDEQFITFVISKATVETPVITVSGNNGIFSGAQLSAAVSFDSLILRVSGFNGTNYSLNAIGATLYAVNAGTYTVTFAIIDSANYQWDDNASSADWVIAKADNNVVTWNNTAAQRTVVYGNAFVPNASATYGGRVYYRYMLKTGDSEPAQSDSGWVTTFNKFNVGDYWVMASSSGTDNYNGDVKIISFTVVKATLTVTPQGSMIYGNKFVNTDPTFHYTVTDGIVYSDDPSEVIKTTAPVTYSVVGSPPIFEAGQYDFVLVSDGGEVAGLEADNYKIVSGTGVFTVNKRSIIVNIGNKTSQYGREVDVSDVTVTYGSQNGLIEGDDLELEFTTTATQTSVKGGYIINATYTNDNYNATINPGTYTITERLITVEIVNGGGEFGGDIVGVTYSKVFDDEETDITSFVNGKLEITVVYTGTANNGTVFNGTEIPMLAGSYLATVKGSGNDNFIVVGEPFTQFVVSKKEVNVSLIEIANQTYSGKVIVPVIDNAKFIAAYGSGIYDELEHDEFINAGDYYITLRLKDADNYKWQSVEIPEAEIRFTIDKAENELTEDISIAGWIYGQYDVQVNSPTASVKFGQEFIVFTYCDTIDGTYYSGAPMTGNVGEYYVRLSVAETDNYKAFESKPVKFEITKMALAVPSLAVIEEGESQNKVYTGGELLSMVLGFDMALMNLDYEGKTNVSGGFVTLVAIDAGTYIVKLSIANAQNYRWEGEDGNVIELSWLIAPKPIAKPTANTHRFIVNGQVLTYLPEGFDADVMTIAGNETAYGGDFTVTVGLKDKSNYVWADGSIDDITFSWSVTGINTVFKIVVGVLSGACGAAVIAAGVQLLLDRRKKRLVDRDIHMRSQAEAKTNTNEGGDK